MKRWRLPLAAAVLCSVPFALIYLAGGETEATPAEVEGWLAALPPNATAADAKQLFAAKRIRWYIDHVGCKEGEELVVIDIPSGGRSGIFEKRVNAAVLIDSSTRRVKSFTVHEYINAF